jgi:ribonuclease D
VLHAAHQDLPCLADVGLRPARLFDTELAGRLLGYRRVGLALIAERVLGLRLAKEHSAVDWSQRPLPAAWLILGALTPITYHLGRRFPLPGSAGCIKSATAPEAVSRA